MYQIAKHIAASQQLKLIQIGAVGLSRTKVKIDYKITDAGPLEYLRLFAHASFIVTNSFHGTAFAVNFNKNFICVPHKTRGTRMISLLNLLKMEHRSITEAKKVTKDFEININFTQANEILEKERQKSIHFLSVC